MKNKIEYILFLSFSRIAQLLGLRLSQKFAHFIALLFFYVIPIRKKTTIENLTIAFPEYSQKKIIEISFHSYRSFAIALMEILYFPYIKKSEIVKVINVANKEIVKKKHDENKGVILLSAHFGNWEYIAAFLSVQLNQRYTIIVKPQRNPFVTEWMNNARTKWLNKVVPLGVSIRQVYKELLDKNIVAMAADQRGPAEGIRVNFFGKSTAIYSGPAVLAIKTGAPMLCGISVRQPDYSYKAEMVEINLENLPEDNDEKIKEVCQRYISYLESVIRKNPEQWLWMHKIWKH